MKNMRENRKRGEGRLIAAALVMLLVFCALTAVNRLPRETVVQPVHAVYTDLYDFVLIDVNSAPEEKLCRLPGIGETLAARIVAFRRENGPFGQAEDLLLVPGIGEETLEGIRSRVKCG